MREIKFRAWLPDDEIMLYYDQDVNDDYMEVWSFEGVEIQEVYWHSPGGNDPEESVRYIKPKNQSIMQYTGIKDKNGKDIYEGDIVNCHDASAKDNLWNLDKEHIGVIVYNGNAFALKVGDVYLHNWINAEVIQVIGNIHESPELLTT